MKKLFTMLLLAVIALPTLAFDDNDYQKFVKEVKQDVWGRNLPQFNNRKVSAQYKDESAVILARYEELTVDLSKKFNIFAFGNLKQNTATHLKRNLIKINDKAALDKFSTFDFRTYDRSFNELMLREDHRTVLGVKVIKPDGTVKEVSTDDYQDANEGKKGQEKRTKLAVPDLQVGDLIDYFIYDFDVIKEDNLDPTLFIFCADYPILDYQIHCAIDKNLCTQYRTMNGAPDFKSGKNGDNITLDAHVKSINKTLPDYAFNAIAQAPFTLLYVTNTNVGLYYTPESAKQKGLQANPDAKVIQKDAWQPWSDYKLKWTLYKKMTKMVKDAKKLKTDEEKADYVYNYMVMQTLLFKQPYENAYNFSTLFPSILDRLKVEYGRGITTSLYNEPLEQLINYSDATRFIILKNGKCYFPLKRAVGANIIPSIYQNRDAIRTDKPKKFAKGPFTSFKIAGSDASDNIETVDIDAVIDGGMMNIRRQNTMSGCRKEGVIPVYTTAEELIKAWGKPYEYTTFADAYNYKESEAKARAAERAERDKKDIPENFAKEVKAYHDKAPVKINSTKVLNFGENNLPFSYTVNYQMDGLVKKAGRNLVVSVGQLFGQQTHIEGKERKRSDAIFFDYPRTYAVTLALTIPSGYSVSPESLQKLNESVDNDAVSFMTRAEVSNGKLVIDFKKIYKHQQEPVANWNKVLDMLDRAYAFTSRQVILKKN